MASQKIKSKILLSSKSAYVQFPGMKDNNLKYTRKSYGDECFFK